VFSAQKVPAAVGRTHCGSSVSILCANGTARRYPFHVLEASALYQPADFSREDRSRYGQRHQRDHHLSISFNAYRGCGT
jgi:hypothetical protein